MYFLEVEIQVLPKKPYQIHFPTPSIHPQDKILLVRKDKRIQQLLNFFFSNYLSE